MSSKTFGRTRSGSPVHQAAGFKEGLELPGSSGTKQLPSCPIWSRQAGWPGACTLNRVIIDSFQGGHMETRVGRSGTCAWIVVSLLSITVCACTAVQGSGTNSRSPASPAPCKTVAVCVTAGDGVPPCRTTWCDCGTSATVTKVEAPCSVSSDTGSCSAGTSACGSLGSQLDKGSCCVCKP